MKGALQPLFSLRILILVLRFFTCVAKTSKHTVLIYAYHTWRRTALIAGHVDIGKACNNLTFSSPASMSTDSISTFTCCCIAVPAIAVVKVKADEKGTAV